MWIKDGQIYTGGGIILDGKRYWQPTDEQFIAAGWERYTPPPAPTPDLHFVAVKAAFWRHVDDAASALSEATGQTYTRADFPTSAYSTELLAWCAEHGMTEELTVVLALRLCAIDADLRRLHREWNELFDEAADA